ncbi:MAG: hypothetical protein QF535_17515 [Anaerolineales bacterium]|jgi:hypothetical protein|nr:hypothetical protein [Anaerolineales bacterium]|tara:strand:- start:3222 stop:3710 length:489 start_codon:yes stop_codon:yes gene_type:complete
MEDKAIVKGVVDVVITRADGSTEYYSGTNTVNSAIKNAMASGLASAVTGGFGVLSNPFDGSDTGFAAVTTGEDGIIVQTTETDYYQASTAAAASGNTGTTMKVVGTVKADASKTIDIAYLGHGATGSAGYDYLVSVHDFGSNIALTDGDQLDITWTITIADN